MLLTTEKKNNDVDEFDLGERKMMIDSSVIVKDR